MCNRAERRQKSASRNFWWDQEFDLELAQASCDDSRDTSASKASHVDGETDAPLVTDDGDHY